MRDPVWHEYETRQALADALADSVSASLAAAVEAHGVGLLAVSGGATPALFFEALAARDMEWPRVVVTLADERFVPPASDRSNERLVRERLLTNRAANARFIGLFTQSENVEAAARAASDAVKLWPTPPDVVVLGMGTDGHTASFFPDADQLDRLLDNPEGDGVLPVVASSAGEPRLTMSAQTIATAGRVVLHIEGEEKRRVIETALSGGSDLPVRRILELLPVPVEIWWTGDH